MSRINKYMKMLEKSFGHLCLFFVDMLSGSYEGVVYRKHVVERSTLSGTEKSQKRKRNVKLHPFTAAGSRFAVPVDTVYKGSADKGSLEGERKTSVKYDRRAMVCEMVMLGADLVESVWEK